MGAVVYLRMGSGDAPTFSAASDIFKATAFDNPMYDDAGEQFDNDEVAAADPALYDEPSWEDPEDPGMAEAEEPEGNYLDVENDDGEQGGYLDVDVEDDDDDDEEDDDGGDDDGFGEDDSE